MAQYWIILLPVVGMACVLVWGLRMITKALSNAIGDPQSITMFSQALSDNGSRNNKASFSRIAGMIGAISLAAFSVRLGLFLLIALATGNTEPISTITDLQNYFLAMATLFAPYSIQQISNIFNNSPDRKKSKS